MAGRRLGLGSSGAGRRATRALTNLLPNGLRSHAQSALNVKLGIAVLPAVLIVLLLLVAIMGVVGAMGGAESAASTCPGAVSVGASGSLTGPPAELIPIYEAAAAQNGLDPDGAAVLAGINRVETDFGKDLKTSSAGAEGWMQFEPGTWAIYGEGGDPNNPHDAIFAAARMLHADGAPGNWYEAVFSYNHADWYVQEVLGYAQQYGGTAIASGGSAPTTGASPSPPASSSAPEVSLAACEESSTPTVPGASAKLLPTGLVQAPAEAPQAVQEMIIAGNQIAALPYVWGGHHGIGSLTGGYDCSSAVSYVMYAGGLLGQGTAGFSNGQFWTSFVAADFVAGSSVPGLRPGPGQWVTVYSDVHHVFMVIAGVRFDDSGSHTRNGKGPGGTNVSMWQPPMTITGFTASHPAGL